MAARADYLDILRRFLDRIFTPALSFLWDEPGREGEWFTTGDMCHFLAYALAVRWKHDGRAEDLAAARHLLLDLPDARPLTAVAAAGAYRLLEGRLTLEEQQKFARRWVPMAQSFLDKFCSTIDMKVAYGNNHRIGTSVFADLCRDLFPDVASPLPYERYTDPVWELWWLRRDFQEHGTGYEGFSLYHHCVWARLRGVEDEFFSSPSILNMFDRALRIVSTHGLVAAYGDAGHPVQPGLWMALFERVAAATGDGRYRQAADDILSRCNRIRWWDRCGPVDELTEIEPYLGRSIYRGIAADAMAVAAAAEHCDESVPAQPRPAAGRIRRLPINEVLRPDERAGGRIADTRYRTRQLALSGGPDGRTWLLLSVGPELLHDHPDAGAIQVLVSGDTELLGTNGYLCREQYYHNTFFAQEADRPAYPDDRPEVGFRGSATSGGSVERLDMGAESSSCRLHFPAYHDLPADLTREFVIDRDGTVTVTDTLTVHEGPLRAGLLFHAEALRTVSPGVFRLRLEELAILNGNRIPNEPGELEVAFLEGRGETAIRELTGAAIYDTNPVYQTFPCSGYKTLWQASYTARQCLTFSRLLAAGETARFVTRLTPVDVP